MSRADQYSVTVVVDGRPLGTFDSMSGGGVTVEGSTRRPGGMGKRKSLGGPSQIEDVTVKRLYDLERDHSEAHWLASIAGQAEASVTKQPLDRAKNPYGRPLVYNGTLMDVTFPDHDSESSDSTDLELLIEVEGDLG